MFKRSAFGLLSALLVSSLAGCGSSDASSEEGAAGPATSTAGNTGASGSTGAAGKGGSGTGQGGGGKSASGGAGGQSGGQGGSTQQGGAGGGQGGKGGAGQGGKAGGAQGGGGNSAKGGEGGAAQGGSGQGGDAQGGGEQGGASQGGNAQGGSAQGGEAQGGNAQAGQAQGGQAQGGGAQGGNGQGGDGQAGTSQGGSGQGGSCSLTLCDGACVDTQSDTANCGVCGKACAVGALCDQGVCKCAPDLTPCAGVCTDTSSDVAHCGACDNACPAGQVCAGSQCGCEVGTTLCQGACVDTQSSVDHCGGCATKCPAGASCDQGACACPGAQVDCAGVCTDTQVDASHCGGCAKSCLSTYVCDAGTCGCAPGLTDCTFQCADLANDTKNCGGCEVFCAQGASCLAGVCTCPAGQGECVPGTCSDLLSTDLDCGSCGNVCLGGTSCLNGTCVCPAAQSLCDGVCVDAADCSFVITDVQPAFGWQNGGDYLTVKGSGFAKGVKVFIGQGRAAVRVVDDKTLRIQTPPGLVGVVDIKIELGASTFTRKQGFEYMSGALAPAWEQKPMQVVRGEDPGIGVLQDGRVLVAGGTLVPDSIPNTLNTAEIYTRTTDTVTPAASAMGTFRWQNSVVTLLDGKALVVGGACFWNLTGCKGDARVADLFDPLTNTFSPTGQLVTGRAYTRSILLVDGRVLVTSANSPTVELYDPDTGTFTQMAHATSHVFGFIVRLRDGRVLLGAGDGGVRTAEVFDADTNTFTPVGDLLQGRSMLTAHALPDGRAIVIGGASSSAGGINAPLPTVEYFDPATNTFSAAPYAMSKGRTWHASALVRDGTVLVMGGYVVAGSCASLDDTVDQLDPLAGTSTIFKKLPNKNTEWKAVTLLDGSVLAVGGGACGTSQALPDIDFLAGAQ